MSFRKCISSIPGARFWLDFKRNPNASNSDEVLPINSFEAGNPDLDLEMRQIRGPGWSSSIGIYAQVNGDDCTFRRTSDNGQISLDNGLRHVLCEVIQIYVKDPNKILLVSAIVNNNIELADYLINTRADVNRKSQTGDMALMWAAKYGNMEIARRLIDKGADLNAQDNGGFTPLMCAVYYGSADIANLLIAKGADVNAMNNFNETALSIAESRGCSELVTVLKSAGAKQ